MQVVKSLFTIIGVLLFLNSCSQPKSDKVITKEVEKTEQKSKYKEPHEYGGWYCPDNFGFKPVDISQLEAVPVIDDRLPTLEETRNGMSLIFIDTLKYPNAKPLDIDLPRLANIYSVHSEMNELAIIIQAVVINEDTVVGYRFPNGGNGSAWLNEVQLLDNKELSSIKPSPFVYLKKDINSSKEEVWKAFTKTNYAQDLAKKFNQKEFFTSEWGDNSRARIDYSFGNDRAKGIITTLYGNLYLHIDYDLNGFHYSEKMLLLEDTETSNLKLHFVAGPFPSNFDSTQSKWNDWLKELNSNIVSN